LSELVLDPAAVLRAERPQLGGVDEYGARPRREQLVVVLRIAVVAALAVSTVVVALLIVLWAVRDVLRT
jgi:hypothetical protein